jgi:hypothetical protein
VGVPPAGSGVSPERTSRAARKSAAQDAPLGGQDAHPTRDATPSPRAINRNARPILERWIFAFAPPFSPLHPQPGKLAPICRKESAPGPARRGRAVTLKINDRKIRRQELPADMPARGAIGLAEIGTGVEFANLLIREF